jgi:hypothetical protein
MPASYLQPCAHYRGEIDAASLCRSVPLAEASRRSSLIGGDPAPLTLYLRGYFTIRYVAVRIAQALGILLHLIQGLEAVLTL